ncbi:hypothetical protein HanOQP8_Chr12g0442011 [Helianthus annuus]|nr:hypothetical protein HanOQP8_Chr12g0442011 [Helianthus annuus]
MCSSSSTPTFFPLHTPRTNRHFLKHPYPFPPLTHDLNINLRPTNPRTRKIISLSSSVAQDNLKLSWASSDKQDVEDYNGWAIVEESVGSRKQSRGLPTFVLVGIGTSVAALLAVFAHFGLSRKGIFFFYLAMQCFENGICTKSCSDFVSGFVLRFSSPFHVSVDKKSLGSEDGLKVDEGLNDPLVENVDEEVDAIAKEVNGHGKREEGKPGRVVVPVSADATQQEALSWLKNLKIIEDEVKADELCTRREYARWLVLVNSRLERNPRHRILPSVALAGSTVNAFNDISAEDPDFEYIQGKIDIIRYM